MGEIIAFRTNARAALLSPPRTEGARILFFLGVRYSREEAETKTPRHRGGGKRKKRA